MPITRSAKKAMRQNVRRRAMNQVKKRNIKNVIKTFKALLAENKSKEALEHLSRVYKILDKSAKSNYIKKNKASRLKSRLAHLMSKSTRASS